MLKTDAEVLCRHFDKTFNAAHPDWCLGLVGCQRVLFVISAGFFYDLYALKIGMMIFSNRYFERPPRNKIVLMGPNYPHLRDSSTEWEIVFTLSSR
jgi:hypothetical protein